MYRSKYDGETSNTAINGELGSKIEGSFALEIS